MYASKGNFDSNTERGQITIAVLATISVLGIVGYYTQYSVILTIVAIAPLAIAIALRSPFLMCIIFICASYFRLHEAYPFLEPFRIPLATGTFALAGLVWQTVLLRSVQPVWTRELKLFALFFLVVTFGLLFATDRVNSWEKWADVWIRISIITVASAWLIRTPSDFQWSIRTLLFSSLLIAAVIIYNKIYGLSLVEGTRVAIGYDPLIALSDTRMKALGILADPNELALILLFPFAFALTLMVSPKIGFDRLFGFVSAPILVMAIVFTQSRGGLIGVLCVGAVVANRVVKSATLIIGAAAVTGLLLFVAMGITDRKSGGSHEFQDGAIDDSAMGRLYAWQAAIGMAADHPLTGVGLSNYVPNYWAYTRVWKGKNKAAHSAWFQVLAETGIPGLIAFMTMIFCTVFTSFRTVKILERTRAPPSVIVAAHAISAALIGLCASASFLSIAFTWPFYIMIALTSALTIYTTRFEAAAAQGKVLSEHGALIPDTVRQ